MSSLLNSNAALAAPALRVQVEQKGDFLLIGNTLGFECAAGTPAPVVGTIGACGVNGINDSAPDIFWRSDSPAAGQAEANTGITVANARSTAVLSIPNGATVTHAFLYWGGIAVTADDQITVQRTGVFNYNVTALQSFTSTSSSYQSVADVTSLVQQQGSGAYGISGVNTADLVNVNQSVSFAGWWMVVFYQDSAAPLRNLALFDGLDPVANANPQNATLTGFLVPPGFGQAKLGIATYEGDNSILGDGFSFDGAALSNAQNPVDNFFNGTRSFLGQPVSVGGDLPQLTGTAQSLSGMDLDVVDVTATLTAGQTSAPISATSTGDQYYLAGFVTSIPTFKPDFSTSAKTATDVNGDTLLPGDQIEYSIVVTNSGSDTAVNTVLTDNLPAGVTYMPGTIQISVGANAGAKTDASADDQCEYTAAQNRITCRVGLGATAAQGGTLVVGATTTVKFRVTVNQGAMGTISNQAVVNAGGQQGVSPFDTPTDGNGPAGGQPPTDVVVEQCATDAQCSAPTPHCNAAATPNVCVECLLDDHCTSLTPTCDPGTFECVCIPAGAEVCDGVDNNCDGAADEGNPGGGNICMTVFPGVCKAGITNCVNGSIQCVPTVQPNAQLEACDQLDNNCDGTVDEGFDLGQPCMSGLGLCATSGVNVCLNGAAVCDGIPGTPAQEICGDGLDQDCDGVEDNGCGDTDNDGLSDADETVVGTDPNDADSDDDGVIDGLEPQPDVDSDGDGLINALDADSDNDGLFDGTEMGFGCGNAATDPTKQNCIADADPNTKTDPLDADTDDGGVQDGAEDANHNGAVDAGETDPRVGHGADDATQIDADADGLSDAEEIFIGTAPNDADSDDDGVIDGQEANPTVDTDGDGLINALDPDSDNDGLFDGTEMGKDCSNPDTDTGAGTCLPDGDMGATTTSPLLADTDGGSVNDGEEDKNHNGVLDSSETDPTAGNGDDDLWCLDDSACGGLDSGKVCNPVTHVCIDGCHSGGNGCPAPMVCTSSDGMMGACVQCTDDLQCGDSRSGKVCDTTLNGCVNGCHTPGNGCPETQICSSKTQVIGTCQECVAGEPACGATGGSGGGDAGGSGGAGGYSNFYDCSYAGGRENAPGTIAGIVALIGLLRRRRRWTS